jgi:hypothetical protein
MNEKPPVVVSAKNSALSVALIIACLLLSLGVYGAGWHIAQSLVKMRLADRVVSIRGVAERNVTADTVTWTLHYTASGDTLNDVVTKIEQDTVTVMAFLREKGFTDADIIPATVNVTDLLAQPYRSGDVSSNRFIMNASVQVRSDKVDAALVASRATTELIKAGVLLTDTHGLSFRFTQLNAIKPPMLVEATMAAREAAAEFVQTSGAELGALKSARQGLFTIDGVDDNLMQTQQVDKVVRVVTTLEYYLAD